MFRFLVCLFLKPEVNTCSSWLRDSLYNENKIQMLTDFTALGGIDFEENVDTTNIKSCSVIV